MTLCTVFRTMRSSCYLVNQVFRLRLISNEWISLIWRSWCVYLRTVIIVFMRRFCDRAHENRKCRFCDSWTLSLTRFLWTASYAVRYLTDNNMLTYLSIFIRVSLQGDLPLNGWTIQSPNALSSSFKTSTYTNITLQIFSKALTFILPFIWPRFLCKVSVTVFAILGLRTEYQFTWQKGSQVWISVE